MVEGNPIPLGLIDFSAPRTSISKFAVIVAFTDELTRTADDRALTLIERVTIRALRHGEDALLLSDTEAVSQGNPAGLLYGLAEIGDGSPATLLASLETLWAECSDGDPDYPAFVASPRGAMFLASLHENGAPLFPNVSPATGGNIYGTPVLLSKAAAEKLVLIDGGARPSGHHDHAEALRASAVESIEAGERTTSRPLQWMETARTRGKHGRPSKHGAGGRNSLKSRLISDTFSGVDRLCD